MLVVDIYTLVLVYSLNFLQQVLVNTFDTLESQNVLWIQRTVSDVFSGFHVIAFCNYDSGPVRYHVLSLFLASDNNFSLVVNGLNRYYRTLCFTYLSKSLRLSGLEELLYSRKTLSDV